MNKKQVVKINPKVLAQQVEDGLKLDALAEFYGLPKTQMRKALKQLDLKIRRFHKPLFEFEEAEEVENTPIYNEVEDNAEDNPATEGVMKGILEELEVFPTTFAEEVENMNDEGDEVFF